MWQIQWMLNLIPDSIFVWITYALFLAGLALYVGSKLVSWIPMIASYRLPVELIGVAALVLAAYLYGGQGYREAIAEMKERVRQAEQQSQQANIQLAAEIEKKQKVIKETVYVNREVIREVAGRQIDSVCSLPNSAVSLHDSASRNEVAERARATDGTSSGVKASELLDRVVENYGACHENTEKLKAWQEWYRTQKRIFESVAK